MTNINLQELAKKKCTPCEGGLPAMNRGKALDYLRNLSGWSLSEDGKTIRAEYVMKNFSAAVALIQKIAETAEQEGHHPDLHLTAYRNLAVALGTHAIGGLSENDFILAAKIEKLPKEFKSPGK